MKHYQKWSFMPVRSEDACFFVIFFLWFSWYSWFWVKALSFLVSTGNHRDSQKLPLYFVPAYVFICHVAARCLAVRGKNEKYLLTIVHVKGEQSEKVMSTVTTCTDNSDIIMFALRRLWWFLQTFTSWFDGVIVCWMVRWQYFTPSH